MACNWLMMTSSAEHHPRRFGYSHRQNYKNKTFKKRKNRALLTLRRSQKHYEIFSNNVLRENITRKQFKRWLGLASISQNRPWIPCDAYTK